LDNTTVDELSAIADRHQYLCTDRGLATVVAELIGGLHAAPAVDLTYADMRRLVYHDLGGQKYTKKARSVLCVLSYCVLCSGS
jgi:hypothetical protein